MKMNPSNFTDHPCGSVFKKFEAENVARNIMVILKRTGDIFRSLSWEEYKKERMNDGNFSNAEKRFFKKVIVYCNSEETAKLFAPNWA